MHVVEVVANNDAMSFSIDAKSAEELETRVTKLENQIRRQWGEEFATWIHYEFEGESK